jgi:acetyl esterase/lipase
MSIPSETSDQTLPVRAYVPPTISAEAARIYERYRPLVLSPNPTPPRTDAEFEAMYRSGEQAATANSEAALQQSGARIAESRMGGVPVLEILPRDYRDDGTVLLHVHGGGFILGSALSTLRASALMARETGKRVISIDYTVAPKGRWQLVTDQIIAVYRATLAEGYAPNGVGMHGESAGGNIVAGTALKIRDAGLPLPAALLLVSPATDLSGEGDTRVLLEDADPVLRPGMAQPGINAYAPPSDHRIPYVSPVFGDFTKGYPPTLIQGGTKEWLLSDMVRLHRAIRGAGGNCRLELYEGMPHGFPTIMIEAPEGREAMAEAVAFWNEHLTKRA